MMHSMFLSSRGYLAAGAVVVAAASFAAVACSSASSNSKPNSSSAREIKYSLVEATGEISVVGGGAFQGCTYDTKLSKFTISLPAAKRYAATFDIERGKLDIQTTAQQAFSGVNGFESCDNKPPVDCSPGHRTAETSGLFISLLDIKFGESPADGLAFRPNLDANIRSPEMCSSQEWREPNNWKLGKPVTVGQLKSGRFVIENSGTAARMQKFEPDGGGSDGPVTGTFTWSYRFVFQSDNYDPANAVASTEFGNFDTCLDEDTEPTAEDIETAQAAFARGDTDIALNSTGCRRLAVSRENGVVTTRMQLTKGTKYIVDAATGKPLAARDTVDTYVREVDANGERERIDADADGFAERDGETQSKGGNWSSTTTRELTKYSSDVVRKVTETRLDATTMRVRFEKGGKLTTEYETSIEQKRCFGPMTPTASQCRPPGSDGTPGPPYVACKEDMLAACSPAAMKQINKLLQKTVVKGSKCLRKFSPDRADVNDKALAMLASGGIKLVCPIVKCDDFGHFNRANNSLMLNLDKSGNDESLQSTLFHELLHLDSKFNHNDGLVDAAAKACKLPIADRAYACESLCFGAPALRCQEACRRCINPGNPSCESDSCSDLPQCGQRREPQPDGSWLPWYDWTKVDPNLISRSVGAYCSSTKTFCDTASECKTECGGIACKLFKATCSGNCN
jgi:hypothetical protein